MKSIKLLPLLLFGLLFIQYDTSACADHGSKKEEQKRMAQVLARSTFKALKAASFSKPDLHPDFMIGNSMLRF
jgi:hypothetical protein